MADDTGNPAVTLSDRLMAVGRGGAAALALGVGFAWLGVYETSQMPFLERVAYWSGLMAVGIIASEVATPLIYDRWLAKWHFAWRLAVITLVISVPVTAGLVVIDAADGIVRGLPWWGRQYFYVVVISGLLTAGAWGLSMLRGGWAAKGLGRAPPAGFGAAAAIELGAGVFLDRLPVRMRAAELYAIQSEDHYLRVHTSAGQELILMRLADAVRELSAVEGLQTHRSWWVAKQGLADVVKGDGQLVLKLKSGTEAPVSRTFAKTVKDAGWL
ncbi:MAG: LytTR family DNA-binding domain-containing protein [Hyphomonadaceae bacterium]|nr:LytTR family DNA-binding domain-containing protein [Hyphomonadaceae bacterium]